jgi:hypothetical protein
MVARMKQNDARNMTIAYPPEDLESILWVRGPSWLLDNRSVFFSVFTLPICSHPAIHASVIVFSRPNRRAICAFLRSVVGYPAKSSSDHFRCAKSSFTIRSAFSASPSRSSAP